MLVSPCVKIERGETVVNIFVWSKFWWYSNLRNLLPDSNSNQVDSFVEKLKNSTISKAKGRLKTFQTTSCFIHPVV